MNRATPVRGLAVALALGALACGGEFGGVDAPDCAFDLAVEPDPAELGQEIQATVFFHGDAFGFHDYDWSVRFEGDRVDFESVSADDDVIEFIASAAGTYSIEVQGSIGGVVCTPAVRDDLNVLASGARRESFLLRVIPRSGDRVPAQDRPIEVWGGSRYNVGAISVAVGVEVAGTSVDAAGQPVPAYLRASPASAVDGTALLTEAFAGADGAYRVRLLSDDHDLLVVPADPAQPPYAVDGVAPGGLSGATVLQPGDPVTGAILDGTGQPVAGARVALVVGGVPSSIAETDGDGRFAVAARPGLSVSVRVVPPDESGLPQLRLDAPDATLAAGGATLAIRYGELSRRSAALDVREADGTTPAPGSRVTWIGRPLAGAGAIAIDGGEPLPAEGLVRRTIEAGKGGALPPALLPEAVYDVVVEPPAGAGVLALAVVDLAEPPAALTLAAPAELRGRVLLGPAGDAAPLARGRGQAAPRGLLAGAAAAGASTRTDAEGRFALAVPGGGDFEVIADAASQGQGRRRLLVTAPAAGAALDLEPMVLPDVIVVDGRLDVEGGVGPLAAAHLQLFCATCGAAGGPAPVAETVADPTGRFQLIAPDPGIDAPE